MSGITSLLDLYVKVNLLLDLYLKVNLLLDLYVKVNLLVASYFKKQPKGNDIQLFKYQIKTGELAESSCLCS